MLAEPDSCASRVRRWRAWLLRHVVKARWFDGVVLACIVASSVVLALANPLAAPGDPLQDGLNVADLVFLCVFAVEALLKIVAMGPNRKRKRRSSVFAAGERMIEAEEREANDGSGPGYFDVGWNWLDFAIVVSGAAEATAGSGGGSSASALRLLRALRPLRSINRLRALKVIVATLLTSFGDLAQVGVLLLFLWAVFSVAAMQLFGGALHQRCAAPGEVLSPNRNPVTGVPSLDAAASIVGFCSSPGGPPTPLPNHSDAQISSSGSTGELLQPLGQCPPGLQCGVASRDPWFGYASFDNFGLALLNVYVVTSLANWTALMYMTFDAVGPGAFAFFLLLTLLTSFFAINLVVAVILRRFEDATADTEDEAAGAESATQEEELAAAMETLRAARDATSAAVAATLAQARAGHSASVEPSPTVSGASGDGRGAFEVSTGGEASAKSGATDGWEDATAGLPVAASRGSDRRSAGQATEELSSEALTGDTSMMSAADKVAFAGTLTAALALDTGSQRLLRVPARMRAAVAAEQQKRLRVVDLAVVAQKSTSRLVKFRPTEMVLEEGGLLAHAGTRLLSAMIFIRRADRILRQRLQYLEGKPAAVLWLNRAVQSGVFASLIMLAIVANTVVLAMDRYDLTAGEDFVLESINAGLTFLFAAEMAAKLLGLGWREYAADGFNRFDALIVVVSLVELAVSGLPSRPTDPSVPATIVSGGALSVLRTFRLLRVLKLARTVKSVRTLLLAILDSLPDVGWMTALLVLFLFIFSVLGVQLFAGVMGGVEDAGIAFDSFSESVLAVLQIVTGDDFPLAMSAVAEGSGSGWSIAYFLLLQSFGAYIVISLFVAVLLAKLAQQTDDSLDEEDFTSLALAWREKSLRSVPGQPPVFAPQLPAAMSLAERLRALHQERLTAVREKRRKAVTGAGGVWADSDDDEPATTAPGHGPAGSAVPSQATSSANTPGTFYTANGHRDSDAAGPTSRSHELHPSRQQLQGRGQPQALRAPPRADARGCTAPLDLLDVTDPSPRQLGSANPPGALADKLASGDVSAAPLSTRSGRAAMLGQAASNRSLLSDDTSGQRRRSASTATGEPPTPTGGAAGASPSGRSHGAGAGGAGQSFSAFPPAERRSDAPRMSVGTADPAATSGHVIDPRTWGPGVDPPTDLALGCLSPANCARQRAYRLAHSPWVEAVVLCLILLSCVCLALDSPELDPSSQLAVALQWLNVVFAVLFALEAAMKVVALGLWTGPAPNSRLGLPQGYLRNAWNLIDAVAVVFSIAALALPSVGALRVLRAVRPVRVVVRSPEIRIVLRALLAALPSIANVTALTLLLWTIFAILGVSLFKGTLSSCTDPSVETKAACNGTFTGEDGSVVAREWGPTAADFDSYPGAMLTLFQASTLSAWAEMARVMMAARGVDLAPSGNGSPFSLVYMASFVVVGSWLCLQLFTGVVIDRFSQLRRELDGSAFQTEKQRRWANTRKLLRAVNLEVRNDPPAGCLRRAAFNVVEHAWFEPAVLGVILANTLAMTLQYYGQSPAWAAALETADWVFLGIFTAEACLKLLGLGPAVYFKDRWNAFDAAVLVVSYASLAFPSGTGAPVLRVFRLGRVLRLVRRARTLHNLFQTLVMALPALYNVGGLLAVLFFVFSVVSMGVCGDAAFEDPDGEGISRFAHFRNIGMSLMTLYRVSTNDAWEGIMRSCRAAAPTPAGESLVTLFFVVFMVTVSMSMLQLLIAVVIETFTERQEADAQEETLERVRLWTSTWNREYDPTAERWVPASLFASLQCDAPAPFGFATTALSRASVQRLLLRVRVEVVKRPHGTVAKAAARFMARRYGAVKAGNGQRRKHDRKPGLGSSGTARHRLGGRYLRPRSPWPQEPLRVWGR
ncbi:hypothetical protein FNF27_04218 [Cafeteria roenbergensis]|uniref:Ion transport domain-containing protein n=1 Tax=Cafeteria roenbergensis TaxID=33653 RepID=A0A5A8E8X0_CAFRO|nr:hypothetical protein FNF27_04218 [Cafeteria roenbergensis]